MTDISVSCKAGKFTGTQKNNVNFFYGIPYAKTLNKDTQWLPPERIDKEISHKASNRGFSAPQTIYKESFLTDPSMPDESIDCLSLNIASRDVKAKMPVMIWIHGGAYISGSCNSIVYDLDYLPLQEIVLVTINYRLGPFGFLKLDEATNGQIKSTGNEGLMDQKLAIQWVKENIDEFGGDSENITLFGESAGGHNVYSLLVSNKAKGLFHKAISMSGYTTSISLKDAYKPESKSSTSNFSSHSVLSKLNEKSAKDFFEIYSQRDSYDELPLLTNDGIAIPKIGLKQALSVNEHLNKVPIIAGSNRDEVKLWLASAEYFVGLDFSFIGSLTNIPRVSLSDKDAFEAFNYYRSKAWQIRGVDVPLSYLKQAGNDNLFAYRFDWDDHRRYVIADFQELLGAAHALEIPLLTGNNKLVGRYGFLLYPEGVSKNFTSKNMMLLWTNFAKKGIPGRTTNDISWENYIKNDKKSYLVIDKKKDMKIDNFVPTFEYLVDELYEDGRLEENEKCVVLFQMGTYVGIDIFDELNDIFPLNCKRDEALEFIESNASFIEY